MGQLEELAGSMLQTGPFSYIDESVALTDDVGGALAASFAALRISDAFAAVEYPSEVLSYSDSPLSLGGGIAAGAMDTLWRFSSSRWCLLLVEQSEEGRRS